MSEKKMYYCGCTLSGEFHIFENKKDCCECCDGPDVFTIQATKFIIMSLVDENNGLRKYITKNGVTHADQ